MNVRFTAWFSEPERDALARAARQEESSLNYIVRKAVRQYLQREHLLHVTSDTSIERDKAA